MGSLGFGQPIALLGLLLLLPLAAAWRLDAQRRASADAAFGGGRGLRRGDAPRRRRVRHALLALAVVAAVAGIARPQWGTEEAPLERRGIDLAIALDISRSMEAQDVEPSRAEAAATGLDALLDRLRGDRAGLVTFAGSAFRRSPLTLDVDALSQLLAGAQAERALVGTGTDVGAALLAALELLDVEDAAETQVIVLVSDGEDLAGAVPEALADARERGVRVYAVPVGTAEGAPLPDESGAPALSRADRGALAGIAQATGGEMREVSALPGLAVEFARLRASDFGEDATREVPIERSEWALVAAALLAAVASWLPGARPVAPLRSGPAPAGALADETAPAEGARAEEAPEASAASGFSRGAAAPGALLGMLVLALALLSACSGSQAYQEVQEGNAAYAAGDYEEALRRYRSAQEHAPDDAAIAYNVGNTLHQLGRFGDAVDASSIAASRTEDADLARAATYAIGNHEFARGNLAAAREAYVSVLLRDPDDLDAKQNLELVLRALQPPPEAEQPPPGQPGEEGEGEEPGEQPPATGTAEPAATPPPEDGGEQGEQTGEAEPGEGPPAEGEPGEAAPRSLTEAQAALEAAIAALEGEPPTEEEALEILELLRITSGLRALPEPPSGPDDR